MLRAACLAPSPASTPQKRVALKKGAWTLKAGTRAERPHELHLLPVSSGLFVLPQISPIAAAGVKQFPDKEIALSHEERMAVPWQVSGAVTKPGATGPCRSTHGAGLLRAS